MCRNRSALVWLAARLLGQMINRDVRRNQPWHLVPLRLVPERSGIMTNAKPTSHRAKSAAKLLPAVFVVSVCVMLASGCEDTLEQPEVITRVGEPMKREAKPISVAADEAMREKLGDPAWRRPKGYVWNHPGGPDSTTYELVDRRMHAAIALSCEFPGPREIARAVARSSPAPRLDGGEAAMQSAYDRYCNERFSLPSEAQLAALEQKIGVVLPDDYRRFVLQFNGDIQRARDRGSGREFSPRRADISLRV